MFFLCAKAHIEIVNTTNPTQKWTKKVNTTTENNPPKETSICSFHPLLKSRKFALPESFVIY